METPAERVLGLLASLRRAQRPVAFEEIRSWFPGAYGSVSPQAAERKFERDKKALLDLGAPLRYVQDEEGARGYVIDEAQLYLPKIELDEPERAAMRAAAEAVSSSGALPYTQSLQLALEKLSAAPSLAQERALEDPKLFETLQGAILARARVGFDYAHGRVTEELVEPYGLLCQRGRWFLVGRSVARGRVERYALSRIDSLQRQRSASFLAPEDFDLSGINAQLPMCGEDEERGDACFAVASHLSFRVERELPGARRAQQEGEEVEGWTRFYCEGALKQELLDGLLRMGTQAKLLSPASWQRELVLRVRAWRAQLEVGDEG